MICPACGCKNKEDDVFCDECGVQLKFAGTASEEKTREVCAHPVVGQVLWERYRVRTVIQSDAGCALYGLDELNSGEAAQDNVQTSQKTPGNEENIQKAGGQVEPKAPGTSAPTVALSSSAVASVANNEVTPNAAGLSSASGAGTGADNAEPQVEGATQNVSQQSAQAQAEPNAITVEGSHLVCEFPSEPEKAGEIFRLLSTVKCDSIWPVQECKGLKEGELCYLLGPNVGVPLRQYMQTGTLSVEEVKQIGCDVLEGLKVFHKLGHLFNAISPDSVWITPQKRAVLVRYDRVVPKYRVAEETCTVLEGFSAPEAYGLEGGELSRRSDIFSTGALMFYLLTGKLVCSTNPACSEFPAALKVKAKELTKIIAKALKRNPEERWLSSSEMCEAIKNCHQSQLAESEQVTASASTSNGNSVMSVDGFKEEIPAGSIFGQVTCSNFGGYTVAKRTNVGAVRRVNQDAFLELTLSVCERDVPTVVQFVGVIDGMGGEAEGDKAASLAARAIASELVRLFLPLKNDVATTLLLPLNRVERNKFVLERVIKKANETIFEYACKSPRRRGMGCTISCALLDGEDVTFGHVGDTRGYRMADKMDQVTTDHSVVGQLVQMGALTREEARRSPKRSIIYRALGTQPDVEVEVYHRVIAPGEYVMLSSDGVWEYYSDEELFAYFQNDWNPARICNQLVDTCLERGADDNTTVVIIRRNA